MAQRLLQLAETRRAMRWERVFRYRTNPLDTFNDADLVKRYRFSRVGISQIWFMDFSSYCWISLACITNYSL